MSKIITASLVGTLSLIFLVSVIVPQFANGQEDETNETQTEALDQSNQHRKWTGDFTGDGHTDVLLYNTENGKWWLGSLAANNQLQWSLISNTTGFGNILSKDHRIWTEDFTGDGRTDVLFHYVRDGHWWLGTLAAANNQLQWSLISDTTGFGNILSNEHRIWTTEDFTGDGGSDILLHNTVNGHWWLGSLAAANNQLQWNLISIDANNQLQKSLISNTS
jgi:hypothetical protein